MHGKSARFPFLTNWGIYGGSLATTSDGGGIITAPFDVYALGFGPFDTAGAIWVRSSGTQGVYTPISVGAEWNGRLLVREKEPLEILPFQPIASGTVMSGFPALDLVAYECPQSVFPKRAPIYSNAALTSSAGLYVFGRRKIAAYVKNNTGSPITVSYIGEHLYPSQSTMLGAPSFTITTESVTNGASVYREIVPAVTPTASTATAGPGTLTTFGVQDGAVTLTAGNIVAMAWD